MTEDYLKGTVYENDPAFVAKFPFLLEAWRRSFPDVDIKSEIAWSSAWQLANHRKKQNARFITNWLGSVQRRISEGRVVRPLSVPPPSYNVKDEDIMEAADWEQMRQTIKGVRP